MESLQVCAAGRAGDGTNTNIAMLGQVLKDLGAWTFVWREEVYSNIQTRDTAFGLRAACFPVFGPDDEFDLLEAFDQGALVDWTGEGRVPPLARLRQGGAILYDTSPRLEYPNAGHELRPQDVERELSAKRARLFGLPMGRMAKERFGNYIVRGTIALGTLAHMLDLPEEPFVRRFARIFGQGSDLFKLNLEAFRAGLEHARDSGWALPDLRPPLSDREGDQRQYLLGNEAVALGSIVAGCRFYAGYPITPASEVLEYMAEKLPSLGGVVIQADSEMAAAHHIIGGSLAGARSMTATSGPGFSLMQEAISAAGMTETPVVIVISQRGGPATGLPTKVGQEDLNETVFGGHGDFARIVLAPTEPEDAFYQMGIAFNLADRYQCPVFVLYDQMFAQSTYTTPPLDPVRFFIDRGKVVASGDGHGKPYRRYALTEDGISPRAFPGTPGIHTIYANTNEHTEEGYITEEVAVRKAMVEKRVIKRMALIQRDPDLPPPRVHGPADAPIGFIGYGSVYGPVLEATQRLTGEGQKAKFMALRTLWPFPAQAVRRFVKSCRVVYVVEYSSTAQLKGLLQREVTGPLPRKLRSILRYDGRPMTPRFVLESM